MGLLFHAQEYPAFNEEFPLFLGFCQENSTVAYDPERMRLRNILWWKDAFHVLDVGKGSVLHDALLMEGLKDIVLTVDEADFGQRVIDISYFHSLTRRRPEDRLFIS